MVEVAFTGLLQLAMTLSVPACYIMGLVLILLIIVGECGLAFFSILVILSCSLRRTALHCAAYSGSSSCVSVLLSAGAAPSLLDGEGISPLHWACAGGNTECAQLLLEGGANPNSMEIDERHLTPLDYAILGSHNDLAQMLIERGGLTIASIQELAAVVIQRVARGFMARRKVFHLRQQLGVGKEEVDVPNVTKEEVTTESSRPMSDSSNVTTSAAVRRR